MHGLVALVLLTQVISAQTTYDLVIRNARILDGAGNAWFAGDVAVRGDTIAAVGKLSQVSASWTLDAKGLTLTPGFIDTHSHGIQGIQQTPAAENLIRQGVTTIIEGPDGRSPLPIAPFLDKLGQRRIGVNFGLLAGHNSIRQQVMGTENRRATPAELESMKSLARQAMLDGAFGLSTGLFYVPGNYAPTEEVIEIAKVVGLLGGIHTSHMRSESDQVVESVKETIRIGEEGHLPTQVTHHKIIGVANWGKSEETLRLIHEARARGVDATLDAYPYTASSTGLGAALVPQWARAGGSRALQERAASPDTGKKLRAEMGANLNETRGGPTKLTLASCGFDRSLAGKTLAEAAGDRDPVEVALSFVLRGDCSVVSHSISEEDIERILRDPLTMIASDGGIPAFGSDVPHPRNYAAFTRVLARYVRERHVVTLEDAVRKMSGLPAQRFGLPDRGLIRPGMKADLVLFDPTAVAENSSFEKPHQYASGVTHVWVNGVCALKDGKMTGALGGRALYGPAHRGPSSALLIRPDGVGPVTAASSHAALLQALGPERVKTVAIHIGEGETKSGTLIDGDDPSRSLSVLYLDAQKTRPGSIEPCYGRSFAYQQPAGSCQWSTASGVTIGTSLRSLNAVNGRPFELAGFGWDYGGTVTYWNGGALDTWSRAARLAVVLEPGDRAMYLPEYQKLLGDRRFSSDDGNMVRVDATVYRVFVRFLP